MFGSSTISNTFPHRSVSDVKMKFIKSAGLAALLCTSAVVAKFIAFADEDAVNDLKLPIIDFPRSAPGINTHLAVRAEVTTTVVTATSKVVYIPARVSSAASGLWVPSVFAIPVVVIKTLGSLPGPLAAVVASSKVVVFEAGIDRLCCEVVGLHGSCMKYIPCTGLEPVVLPIVSSRGDSPQPNNGACCFARGCVPCPPKSSESAGTQPAQPTSTQSASTQPTTTQSSAISLRTPRLFIFLGTIRRALGETVTKQSEIAIVNTNHDDYRPPHNSASLRLLTPRIFLAFNMIRTSFAQMFQECTDCSDPFCVMRNPSFCYDIDDDDEPRKFKGRPTSFAMGVLILFVRNLAALMTVSLVVFMGLCLGTHVFRVVR